MKDYESLDDAFQQLDDYSRAEIAWMALVACAGSTNKALEYIATQMDWNLTEKDE